MSKICSSCGAELEDSATFCGKCGKPVSLFTPQPEAAQTTSGDMPAAEDFSAQQQYQQQYQQQPQYQQPYGGQQQYQQQPQYQQPYNQSQYMGLNETVFSPYERGEKPVTIGQWMITTILLSIPVVGLIYFIILLIGGPNTKKSLTNFARASLIWFLIAFAICLIAVLAFGASAEEILKTAGVK